MVPMRIRHMASKFSAFKSMALKKTSLVSFCSSLEKARGAFVTVSKGFLRLKRVEARRKLSISCFHSSSDCVAACEVSLDS